jgi:hypothetical protein
MSDEPQGATFQIEKIYVKDLSLEIPNAPPPALADRPRPRRPDTGGDGGVDRCRDDRPALGWHRAAAG